MPGLSFQKIVADCELLSTNLKPHLADMPHLQDESEGLEALIAEAKTLRNEQVVLTGRLREITRLRQEAQRQSQDLRSRVVAQLRGKLGFENENLIGFGIPPRKRSRKKAEQKVTPQQPAPTVPTTPVPPVGSPEPAG